MRNLITPAEVCDYLRISRTMLWRMEKDGELLPYRFRGKVFYEQADVDAFLDSKKVTLRTLPTFGDSRPGPKTDSPQALAENRPGDESPGERAKGKKSVGKEYRQRPAVVNGVIAATPISQRSSRAGYFAPVAFGTAVAEIDSRYQRENRIGENN